MINQKWTSHISHATDDLRATVPGTASAAAVIVMDTDAARRITAPPAAPKKKTERTDGCIFQNSTQEDRAMAGFVVPVGRPDRTRYSVFIFLSLIIIIILPLTVYLIL